jgi:hypothetical protein
MMIQDMTNDLRISNADRNGSIFLIGIELLVAERSSGFK